jgi:hypothetical protein
MTDQAIWPDPPLKTSKVAIVGFATETMGEAPFEDPDCEIWILNMLHAHVPRWDRLFELHDRVTLEQETAELKKNMDHLGYLQKEATRPIYMVEVQPDIPMSRRMPIELLKDYLRPLCDKIGDTPYYTSTFAFMVALAIKGIVGRRVDPRIPEDGEVLHICGVEMLNETEYGYQRSCAEFWCGVVLGHGIKLVIPSRSALLESDGIYGYARPESLELLGRMREYYVDKLRGFKQKREEAATRRQQAMADWNTYDGSVQGVEWVINHVTYLIRGGKV